MAKNTSMLELNLNEVLTVLSEEFKFTDELVDKRVIEEVTIITSKKAFPIRVRGEEIEELFLKIKVHSRKNIARKDPLWKE